MRHMKAEFLPQLVSYIQQHIECNVYIGAFCVEHAWLDGDNVGYYLSKFGKVDRETIHRCHQEANIEVKVA